MLPTNVSETPGSPELSPEDRERFLKGSWEPESSQMITLMEHEAILSIIRKVTRSRIMPKTEWIRNVEVIKNELDELTHLRYTYQQL